MTESDKEAPKENKPDLAEHGDYALLIGLNSYINAIDIDWTKTTSAVADRDAIMRVLERYASQPAHSILLYYAGHGAYRADRESLIKAIGNHLVSTADETDETDETDEGGVVLSEETEEESPAFLAALGDLESALDRVIYRLDRRNTLLNDSLLELRTAREILADSNQRALARISEAGTSVWPSVKL